MFQMDLQQKIASLQNMYNEVQLKKEELDQSYSQCLKELQLEYDITISHEKSRLEEAIKGQLKHIVTDMIH